MKKLSSGTVVPFPKTAARTTASRASSTPAPAPSVDAAPVVVSKLTPGSDNTLVSAVVRPTPLRQPASARPKRLIATLKTTPYRGSQTYYPVGKGVLVIRGMEFTHSDPLILGTAAAIAGVTSVVLQAAGLPQEGLKLKPLLQQLEFDALEQSMKAFVGPFCSGFDIARKSSTWSRWHVDRCEKEHWEQANEMLPLEMRQLTGLTRGVYDEETGLPMTARTIARKAKSGRFLAIFKGAMSLMAQVDAASEIIMGGATQLLPDRPGDVPPIVYTPVAEASLRKLMAQFECGLIPLTRPDLEAFFKLVDNKVSQLGKEPPLRII